jgi:hypothetical protein
LPDYWRPRTGDSRCRHCAHTITSRVCCDLCDEGRWRTNWRAVSWRWPLQISTVLSTCVLSVHQGNPTRLKNFLLRIVSNEMFYCQCTQTLDKDTSGRPKKIKNEIKMNGTCLVYPAYANSLSENMYTITRNTEAVSNPSLEVNTQIKQSVCQCLVNRLQDKNIIINIANKTFENVTKFKFLRKTVSYSTRIHEKWKAN